MADIVDLGTRSRMMAAIGGRNTRPEISLRSAIHRRGLRFRLHVRDLPGRPDIVLPRHRAVIFVHGCFWHRHADCRLAAVPKTRPDFWNAKFRSNVERDARVVERIRALGWTVILAWECEIRRDVDMVADRVTTQLEKHARGSCR